MRTSLSAFFFIAATACGDSDADVSDSAVADASTAPDATRDVPPEDLGWLEPGSVDLSNPGGTPTSRMRGPYQVVWLTGSPYEMGRQHGEMLHDALAEGVAEVDRNPLLHSVLGVARDRGLFDLAEAQSYPEVVEECRGLVDAAGDVGFTFEKCMLLNFGDVIVEFIRNGTPEAEDITPGCTQIVASGEATRDGRTYHARLLDWAEVEYVLHHPVIFVRRPEGGIPHVVVGFPGNLSAYTGMNASGLVVASNEAHPIASSADDLTGRSHVQLVSRILATAHSMDEARALVLGENSMSLESIVISDASGGSAFELAPAATAERPLDRGVVFQTNHFVGEETAALDLEPPPPHSAIRWERLLELLTPEGRDTVHGQLDPASLVRVMRDRMNPRTREESPAGEFDDGKSLATNGALFAVVFDPAARAFWVAAGRSPVPAQPFAGFSLPALLGESDALVDPMR